MYNPYETQKLIKEAPNEGNAYKFIENVELSFNRPLFMKGIQQ